MEDVSNVAVDTASTQEADGPRSTAEIARDYGRRATEIREGNLQIGADGEIPAAPVEAITHADEQTDPQREFLTQLERQVNERADALLTEQIEMFAGELGVDAGVLRQYLRATADPEGYRAEQAREAALADLEASDYAADLVAEGDRQARELISGFADLDVEADEVLAEAYRLWPQVEREVAAMRLRWPGIEATIGDGSEVAASVLRMAAENIATVSTGERRALAHVDAEARLVGAHLTPQQRQEAYRMAEETLRVRGDGAPEDAARQAIRDAVRSVSGRTVPVSRMALVHHYASRARAIREERGPAAKRTTLQQRAVAIREAVNGKPLGSSELARKYAGKATPLREAELRSRAAGVWT